MVAHRLTYIVVFHARRRVEVGSPAVDDDAERADGPEDFVSAQNVGILYLFWLDLALFGRVDLAVRREHRAFAVSPCAFFKDALSRYAGRPLPDPVCASLPPWPP